MRDEYARCTSHVTSPVIAEQNTRIGESDGPREERRNGWEGERGQEKSIWSMCETVRRINAINLVDGKTRCRRFGGTRCRYVDASAVYRTMENSRSDNRIADGGGNHPRLCSARRLYENNELVRRGVGLLPRDRSAPYRIEREREYPGERRTRTFKTEIIRTWTRWRKGMKKDAEHANAEERKGKKIPRRKEDSCPEAERSS